jgi:hypothetical protein
VGAFPGPRHSLDLTAQATRRLRLSDPCPRVDGWRRGGQRGGVQRTHTSFEAEYSSITRWVNDLTKTKIGCDLSPETFSQAFEKGLE